MGCVYLITNTVNGKQYVGKTIMTAEERLYCHFKASEHGSKLALHSAIRKYGSENFQISILKESELDSDLLSCEIDLISKLKTKIPNGYNMTDGGEGTSGFTMEFTIEHRKNLSLSHKGKILSEEHKQNLSKTRKGRKKSEEHKRKIGEANKGKRWKHSEESKKKISEAVKQAIEKRREDGRDVEHHRKLSESLKGKHHSEETKRKLSEARKAYYRRLKGENEDD